MDVLPQIICIAPLQAIIRVYRAVKIWRVGLVLHTAHWTKRDTLQKTQINFTGKPKHKSDPTLSRWSPLVAAGRLPLAASRWSPPAAVGHQRERGGRDEGGGA